MGHNYVSGFRTLMPKKTLSLPLVRRSTPCRRLSDVRPIAECPPRHIVPAVQAATAVKRCPFYRQEYRTGVIRWSAELIEIFLNFSINFQFHRHYSFHGEAVASNTQPT